MASARTTTAGRRATDSARIQVGAGTTSCRIFKRHEDYFAGADAMHGAGNEWRVEKQRLHGRFSTRSGLPRQPLAFRQPTTSIAATISAAVTSTSTRNAVCAGTRSRRFCNPCAPGQTWRCSPTPARRACCSMAGAAPGSKCCARARAAGSRRGRRYCWRAGRSQRRNCCSFRASVRLTCCRARASRSTTYWPVSGRTCKTTFSCGWRSG